MECQFTELPEFLFSMEWKCTAFFIHLVANTMYSLTRKKSELIAFCLIIYLSFIIIPNRISFIGQIIENYQKFTFKISRISDDFNWNDFWKFRHSNENYNWMRWKHQKKVVIRPIFYESLFFFSKDFNKEEILNGGCAIWETTFCCGVVALAKIGR